jgi:hypothetical protein
MDMNILGKNEKGLNPIAPEEQDKKYKEQMKKHSILKQPAMMQTLMVAGIGFLIFIANYTAIITELSKFWMDLTGLQLKTLFFMTFGLTLVFFMYAFLMNYWSGFIIHKVIYAKLFRKRVVFCKGTDKIFRFLVVDKTAKTYYVDGIGEWAINEGAMGWLENGLIMALCKEGFGELIDLNIIESKYALTVDDTVFEDRIRRAKLEAQIENSSLLNPKTMMFLIPLVLVIGIAGYMVMMQMQSGSCQAELVQLAQTCGQTAKAAADEAAKSGGQTIVDKMPVINKIV